MSTFVQSVSETGYLVLVYQRWPGLVKFFSIAILFFDGLVLRPKSCIGLVRASDIVWEKALSTTAPIT